VPSQERILELFSELNDELCRVGVRGDVFIVGGAAMAVAYDARRATRDVDGIWHPSAEIRSAAARVAARHDDLDGLARIARTAGLMARQYRHVRPATRRSPPETARYRLIAAVATAIASAWAAHSGWLGDPRTGPWAILARPRRALPPRLACRGQGPYGEMCPLTCDRARALVRRQEPRVAGPHGGSTSPMPGGR
jgi:Nucleotidyltransferase of unknown function (DUF6036)